MGFDGFLVPDWAKPYVGWVVGMDWPEGDESRCFRLADACVATAKSVETGRDLSESSLPGQDWDGDALKAFAEHVRTVSGGMKADLIEQLVTAALEFNRVGVQVEYTKKMIEVSVWFLIFQIGWLLVVARTSPLGAPALAMIGLRMRLTRAFIAQLGKRLLFNVGLFGALGAGMDFAVQASQSRRDHIDWKQVRASAEGGALNGVFLTLFTGLSPVKSMAELMRQAALASGATAATTMVMSDQPFDLDLLFKSMTAGALGGADAHWASWNPSLHTGQANGANLTPPSHMEHIDGSAGAPGSGGGPDHHPAPVHGPDGTLQLHRRAIPGNGVYLLPDEITPNTVPTLLSTKATHVPDQAQPGPAATLATAVMNTGGVVVHPTTQHLATPAVTHAIPEHTGTGIDGTTVAYGGGTPGGTATAGPHPGGTMPKTRPSIDSLINGSAQTSGGLKAPQAGESGGLTGQRAGSGGGDGSSGSPTPATPHGTSTGGSPVPAARDSTGTGSPFKGSVDFKPKEDAHLVNDIQPNVHILPDRSPNETPTLTPGPFDRQASASHHLAQSSDTIAPPMTGDLTSAPTHAINHPGAATAPHPGPAPGPFKILADTGLSGDGFVAPGVWGKYGAAGVLIKNVDAAGVTRYLLVERGPMVDSNVGKWQLPGGALDSKETAHQGAARELSEELGVDQGYLDKLKLKGMHVVDGPNGWKYTNIAADGEMFTPKVGGSETSDAKWVTLSELSEMSTKGQLHPELNESIGNVLSFFDNGLVEKGANPFTGKADIFYSELPYKPAGLFYPQALTTSPFGALLVDPSYGARVWGETIENLPAGEHEAIRIYTFDGYRWINGFLREEGNHDHSENMEGAREQIDLINAAAHRQPLPHTIDVFRAVDMKPGLFTVPIEELPGTVQREPGFMSTVIGNRLNSEWGDKNIHFHLRVPRGTPAIYIESINPNGDFEFLLASGRSWFAEDVVKIDGIWHIFGWVLPEETG
ncbi:ADP-ribosyltransferase [Streptosporangium sp. CA-135522]|uniref:ADP-ribosyltransferase n=1 Tax=Streptosporangium sp. CA-135522 TaxID=3240072 RepID=UPI003D8CFE76